MRYRAEQSRTSVRNEIFDYGSAAAHSHFPYVSGVDYVELTLRRRRWSRPQSGSAVVGTDHPRKLAYEHIVRATMDAAHGNFAPMLGKLEGRRKSARDRLLDQAASIWLYWEKRMVDATGIEPVTPTMST